MRDLIKLADSEGAPLLPSIATTARIATSALLFAILCYPLVTQPL